MIKNRADSDEQIKKVGIFLVTRSVANCGRYYQLFRHQTSFLQNGLEKELIRQAFPSPHSESYRLQPEFGAQLRR